MSSCYSSYFYLQLHHLSVTFTHLTRQKSPIANMTQNTTKMDFDFPKLSTYTWSCKDTSKQFDVDNPATGRVLTRIQAGDESTVDRAVHASQVAFEQRWRPLPPRERSTYLLRCADALESHADELATLLCLENGKPAQDARMFDVNFLIGVFRFFGSLCDKLPSEFYDRGAMYATVFYEPYGVTCGILPFNWPPIHTGGKLAPALAAGNTMILKPGEQAPLTMIRIVEIVQSVLPKDVVQFVPGLGPEVPQALVTHPLVKMVSFTGSTIAGAAVAKSASASITPVVLELGGKNAFVVFEDADFDLAVRDALDGAFFNKGEACTATSRLLIHRSLYERFVEKLAAGVQRIKQGNGMDPATLVGPQVSRAQQKRVLDYIDLGKKEGARVAAQAQMPSGDECKDGFFAPVTLFADVKEEMRIAQEEMFGTVGKCKSSSPERCLSAEKTPSVHSYGHALRHLRRRHPPRQRVRLRPHVRHLHARPAQREPRRACHHHGYGVGQQLQPQHARHAVWRRQALRVRA